MLDTSNDDFNREMQHVGSAVGLSPVPSLISAGELTLQGLTTYREVVRTTVALQLAFPVFVGAAMLRTWLRT